VDVIHWQTSIDLNPTGAFAHYGSPVFTPANTVIIPIKTGGGDGFEVAARNGATGNLLWTLPSDYTTPPHSWLPPYGPTLTSTGRLYFPGNGGTVYYVDNPDTPGATVGGQLAFYGIGNYQGNPAGYNGIVFIDTPLTADNNGNIYFGFMVTGANPSSLVGGGIARIDAAGNGSYVLASDAADGSVSRAPLSAAPALSNDGTTLYAALNNTGQYGGYLVALDSTTLATKFKVALKDPRFNNANAAGLINESTATPFVAPDNTVFMSIFGNPYNGSRGFLLHFSADLATEYTPGAFGWDDTQSIVPASAVPSYHGTSSYLIFSKYNDYVAAEVGGSGGAGDNKVAILDPYASQPDPNNDGDPNLRVMREVLTMIGPTPDADFTGSGYPNAVREWCINDTAIDPFTKSALVNSEDGNLYRWDLATNTLSQMVHISLGIGEPYTPTSVGPDGTVYVLNGGTLFAVGGFASYSLNAVSSLNMAAVGQAVTLTATMASTSGGPTPTGAITFSDGSSVLAVVPLVNGRASTTASFANPAAHFLTAAYGGDGTYSPGSTTFVLRILPPVPVQSAIVNDGSAQRSMVDSVTITFPVALTLSPGAFQLQLLVPGSFPVDVSNLLQVSSSLNGSGHTVATLTFGGNGVVAGSLADGRYQLLYQGSPVQVANFFRLFGDVNGDGQVDATDRTAFLASYRSRRGMPNYRWYFDFNNDGAIDSVDYFQFLARLGSKLNSDGTISLLM
jgi:hypothetical protein